jgi:hypothetical protein
LESKEKRMDKRDHTKLETRFLKGFTSLMSL